jgi:hypothetical protein
LAAKQTNTAGVLAQQRRTEVLLAQFKHSCGILMGYGKPHADESEGVNWWTWRGSNSRPHDCQSFDGAIYSVENKTSYNILLSAFYHLFTRSWA